MHYSYMGGDAFAALRLDLAPGDIIKAEHNAMVAMGGGVQLGVKLDGGLLRGLARRFAGERAFFQQIRADAAGGWVLLAPQALGQIAAIELDGTTGLTAEKGAFLAATRDVQISAKLQRLATGLLGGEGFVVTKVTGNGTVFLSAFGALQMLSLLPGQTVTVDNTHLVAWEDTVQYGMGRGGASWLSAVLGGEALVANMTGPGRVWLQTRTPRAFHSWLRTLSPPAKAAKSEA